MMAFYRRTLDIALRYQFLTLLGFLRDDGAHRSSSMSTYRRAFSRSRTPAS